MKKRVLELLEGVDNIELFYDLIFVYCISVITGMAHPHDGGFFDVMQYGRYMLTLCTVLQVWFYTTLLMNRYGAKTPSDYTCLFFNMFFLYFMASSFGGVTEDEYFTFDLAWTLILVNMIVHWLIKRFRYSNIDDDDRAIIDRTVAALVVQCILVLVATLLDGVASRCFATAGFAVGFAAWSLTRVYRRKPARFEHIAERCSLLVIVVFGETVVTIATFMQAGPDLFYPVFVFAMVVGMFLIYIYEYDRRLDHHANSDGMMFMKAHAGLVMVISNVTIALEFMPDPTIDFLPKSIYMTLSLVLYLLASFLLNRFSRPLYRASIPYTVGRLLCCAAIVVAALGTNFDPRITLLVDTLAIFAAFGHEVFLFHGRNSVAKVIEQDQELKAEVMQQSQTFGTFKGSRSVAKTLRRHLGKRE